MNKVWWKEAIIYQVYPFSFMDSNNDGWGDIKGIISKLDHIKDLGATAIWFSPLYVSPCNDYGYDISDYYNIDPKFGTMEDFDKLVDECHKRNLKVIMDMVINHTSSEHEWFRKALKGDHKYRNYYIIKDGIEKNGKLYPPTNYSSSFTGSAWERIGDTNEYYLHIFDKTQPDLNWENNEVREEIIKILNFWFEKGVDGYRFDVFNLYSKKYPLLNDNKLFSIPRGGSYFIDGPRMHEFLRELNELSFSKYDSYTVGESYMPSETDAYNYVKKSNNELNSIFDFSMFKSDTFFGLGILKKRFNIMDFKKGFFNPQKTYYKEGWNTLVLENHDNPRSINRFNLDSKNYHYEVSTMLPTLVFLGFGIPYIYMGEESGINNPVINSIDECMDNSSHSEYNLMLKLGIPKKKALSLIQYGARDNARCPLPWNDSINSGFNKGAIPWMKVNDTYKLYNIEKDKKNIKSIYKYYQRLLTLKKTDTFIYGDVKEINHFDRRVIAYERFDDNNKYLVITNFTKKYTRYKLPKEYINKRIEFVLSNYSTIERKKGIILKPYQAIVFKVD